MRIIFICGSIEPGMNGVGDYTRSLAIAFINRGYEARILAINEQKLPNDGTINYLQSESNISVETYRLSSGISWQERQVIAKKIIAQYEPTYVSLQFVPFSYHPKGLPSFLPNWLSGLKSNGQSWQIMFHELWVADSKANSVKELILRELQKVIINKLLKKIKPSQIITSNDYYCNMLRRIGYKADVMPIFSNLPKGEILEIPNIENRKDKVIGVFFGNIQSNNSVVDKIITISAAIQEQMNKELVVLHIGNNRNNIMLDLFKKLNEANVEAYALGFIAANDAANVIASSDVGFSNYLPELIYKSGSISSMLYNGIPVLLLGDKQNSEMVDVPEVRRLKDVLNMKDFIMQEKTFSSRYSADNTFNKMQQSF